MTLHVPASEVTLIGLKKSIPRMLVRARPMVYFFRIESDLGNNCTVSAGGNIPGSFVSVQRNFPETPGSFIVHNPISEVLKR